jgi:hypothetical protein
VNVPVEAGLPGLERGGKNWQQHFTPADVKLFSRTMQVIEVVNRHCEETGKEVMNVLDEFDMFAYGTDVLPLICHQLKEVFPLVEQPWYANDAGAGRKFDRFRSQFLQLAGLGPTFGYFPNPTKNIIIVAQHNLESTKVALANLAFKVKTGERYQLGGFIEVPAALYEWLEGKIQHWSMAVAGLACWAAAKFPQSAYPGLQQLLQQEWQFVQRVLKDIDEKFPHAKKEMSQTFLPALFDDTINSDDPCLALACHPVCELRHKLKTWEMKHKHY